MQAADWEKIFAIDFSNKRIISRIYKDLLQIEKRQPNRKIG